MAQYIIISHDQADDIRLVAASILAAPKYDAREIDAKQAALPVGVLDESDFQEVLHRGKIDIGDYRVLELPDDHP